MVYNTSALLQITLIAAISSPVLIILPPITYSFLPSFLGLSSPLPVFTLSSHHCSLSLPPPLLAQSKLPLLINAKYSLHVYYMGQVVQMVEAKIPVAHWMLPCKTA